MVGFLVVLSGEDQGQNACGANEEEASDGSALVEGFLGVFEHGGGILGVLLNVFRVLALAFLEAEKLTSQFSFVEFGAVLKLSLQVCHVVKRFRIITE